MWLAYVFMTSVISGIFGMAGGLILMSLLVIQLAVPTAMVVHAVAQAVANLYRFFLLRRHVQWRTLGYFCAGSLFAAGVFALFSFVPDQRTVFFGLGLMPFVGLLLPKRLSLDFARPQSAALCGALVTGTQIVAGVAGPILDVFFVRTELSKVQIISTKALTSGISHLVKLAYFLPLLGAESVLDKDILHPLHPFMLGLVILNACAGTRVGIWIMGYLDDAQFKRIGRWLILAIGAYYLGRALLWRVS